MALGTALGFLQHLGARITALIRTFAVVSAGLVAAFSLLPHAVSSEGLWGVAAAVLAFAAIPVLERVLRLAVRGARSSTLRLEIGYAALLVHRFGDGVAMRVEGHGADVLLSLGAHEIPIVALVMLAYAKQGTALALLRVALLGLASTLGCAMVDVMPAAFDALHGWVDAIAAGILLHIVSHELTRSLPEPGEHPLEILCAAAAGSVLWAPGEEGAGLHLAGSVLAWSLTVAPGWLLALVLVTALRAWPLRSKASDIALDAGSESRVENVTLSLSLLGWRFAALRLLGASSLAAVTRMARRSEPAVPSADAAPPCSAELGQSATAGARGFGVIARESLLELWAWLALGILGAAYIETLIPPSTFVAAFAPPSGGLLFAIALALALFARKAPAGAAPVLAALLDKGIPPAAALLGVWLGLLARRASLTLASPRSAEFWARWLLSFGIAAGLAWIGQLHWLESSLARAAEAWSLRAPRASALAWGSLGVLCVLTLWGMLRYGVRGWIAGALGARVGGGNDAPRELECACTRPAAVTPGSTRSV